MNIGGIYSLASNPIYSVFLNNYMYKKPDRPSVPGKYHIILNKFILFTNYISIFMPK